MASQKELKLYTVSMTKKVIYKCPECGLHYEQEHLAKQCEAYCKENQGCSMDITKNSIERKKLITKKRNGNLSTIN